jgi:hypothetical protein
MLLTAIASLAICLGTLRAEDATPQGNVALPAQVVVFGPFTREDGVPGPEFLRRIPETLVIGDKQVTGRAATFDAQRCLDCAPFCGSAVGNTTWVYLAFKTDKSGLSTFGFGADWWYEAYLDGALISETLSHESQGNETWPPSIRDFLATVELAKGAHVLAIRFLRGSGSAKLAVGGPLDLRNPAIRKAPNLASANITKVGHRDGPPPSKKWKLVWNDEFNGTSLDTAKWHVQPLKEWTWPDMKIKPEPGNMFLDGKGSFVLQLTQDADGTIRHAGSINSRFEKAYGYFETRVQFSRQPGWWTAVWMAGYPYDCGVDAFIHSQEFDIFEDFYKPKKQNDISHCYHCSVKLDRLPSDQGNAKGVGEGGILDSTKLSRTSSGRKVVMEDYNGWHTVGFQWTPLEYIFYVDGQETLRQSYREVPMTDVPQKIWISSCLRTPKLDQERPFYGRLEEAQFPDRLVVDYVRIYEHDTGGKAPPHVTLTPVRPGPFKVGESVSFRVTATSSDSTVNSLLLFSMGRIRAEKAVNAAKAETVFTVSNLFPMVNNTVIAMARDDAGLIGKTPSVVVELISGREYTGTAWQGKAQKIPGKVLGGCYDEGGNGVAFQSDEIGSSDARLDYRQDELGDMPEAVGVGGSRARWITYEVEVAEAGEYEVALFMNRCDYYTKGGKPGADQGQPIHLKFGEAGSAGRTLSTWQLPISWDSGYGWRRPQKLLGTQKVQLPAGRHKLVLDCKGITVRGTFFCMLEFRAVLKQE